MYYCGCCCWNFNNTYATYISEFKITLAISVQQRLLSSAAVHSRLSVSIALLSRLLLRHFLTVNILSILKGQR